MPKLIKKLFLEKFCSIFYQKNIVNLADDCRMEVISEKSAGSYVFLPKPNELIISSFSRKCNKNPNNSNPS